MFDWDKIVIEVDNNIVDLTAGEVALLIAADADTVTWGNITGDITQQPDLMLELDSKIGVDSPEFTGVPRTPTPPAGNSSTRIANTKFVNDTVSAAIPVGGFGALASKDNVNYDTEITNKPVLGALSSKSTVNYETEVTNKPTFGTLAYKNSVNYGTEVTNKPSLYDLSGILPIESGGTGCNSEQELKDYIMSLIDPEQEEDHKVRYYVDGDQGNDRTGDGSSENPFKTIQKAIDTASPFTETTINVLQGAFGEILTIEEKNIQITMVPRQTPYYPGLWLIHNQTTRALDAAINVKNGTLQFYGNLRIDTVGDGIYIENGYVYLDGDPETDAVRINNTRTDNSGQRAVGVMERSVFVCADNIKLYAYFNEVSGVQSNNIGISCHDWSYASVDSIQATYIGTLFFLYNSSLVYCGEATGSYVRYSMIQKSAFPNTNNLGTLAYKNSVNYETEVYNKLTAEKLYELMHTEYDFYVDGTNGNDTTGNGSTNAPFKTIQKAINEVPCYCNGSITITPGEYQENLTVEKNKTIHFYSYGISSSNPGIVNIVAIWQNFARAISVTSNSNASFTGFFILEGLRSNAVYVVGNSSITFTDYYQGVECAYSLESRGTSAVNEAVGDLIRVVSSKFIASRVTLSTKTGDQRMTLLVSENSDVLLQTIELNSKFNLIFYSLGLSDINYKEVVLGEGISDGYNALSSSGRGGRITNYEGY